MKHNQTLHIPRWFAKFILNETKTQPNNQQIFLAILEPMSPQEWCRIWIPIIHPDVEAPYPGERSPPGYMKASIMTLCKLTGGGRMYGFMDGFTEKLIIIHLGYYSAVSIYYSSFNVI